ncbi:MAG: hypothetical protein FWC61_01170 [Proteobacteria bacterium]|nr:hypothetical protein [Pseudomonadota bacterium]
MQKILIFYYHCGQQSLTALRRGFGWQAADPRPTTNDQRLTTTDQRPTTNDHTHHLL